MCNSVARGLNNEEKNKKINDKNGSAKSGPSGEKYMSETMFGIFHTAYERAGKHFFDIAACDYVNTVLVESDYKSEEFAVSLNELKKHPDKRAWVACSSLGFITKNEQTVADTGEKSEFNPHTEMRADYKARINEFIDYLKQKGWYDTIVGFYMDEPLLWNVKNDDLEEFSGYFRTVAAPDKRFFVCFSIAGVAPEFWTINDVKPITPKSSQYLTDIAFDMYHKWSDDYLEILRLMKERAGNREDLRIWMIPCTMNYRGNVTEEHCLEHLNNCYEVLKKQKNPGGLMCFTYYTFKAEEEDLGNIGLDKLSDPLYNNYWKRLINRIKEIGREIVSQK